MEIENIVSFSEKYLIEYVRLFVRILAHPIETFQPIDDSSDIEDNETDDIHPLHQPLAFLFISIFLGSVFNSFVPSRKYSPDIVGNIVLVFSLWMCFATFTHILCRIFRGKAKFIETIFASLYVFSALYVVSSFVNLIGGVIVRNHQISSLLVSTGKIGDSIANNPFYIYFLVQFVLLNIYLPFAIKKIHKFGWIRPILVCFSLSIFWVLFAITLSSDIGIRYMKL